MRKIVYGSILSSIYFIITGCAGTPYSGMDKIKKNVDHPQVGSIQEAYLGEPLLTQGESVTEKYLRLNQDINGKIWVLKSSDFRAVGANEKAIHFSPSGNIYNNFGGGVPPASISISTQKTKEVCVHAPMAKTHCYAANYDLIEKEVESAENFQQTLIYNGKVGNKINISYRETSGGYARPAFNNQVEYDLDESNEIGYKSAVLNIIEADNKKIKYKLIRGFR